MRKHQISRKWETFRKYQVYTDPKYQDPKRWEKTDQNIPHWRLKRYDAKMQHNSQLNPGLVGKMFFCYKGHFWDNCSNKNGFLGLDGNFFNVNLTLLDELELCRRRLLFSFRKYTWVFQGNRPSCLQIILK